MKLIRAHLPLFRILNSKFGIDCPASYLLFFVDLLLLSINTVTGELPGSLWGYIERPYVMKHRVSQYNILITITVSYTVRKSHFPTVTYRNGMVSIFLV